VTKEQIARDALTRFEPAVIIRVPLEGPPQLLHQYGTESELVRLLDWLDDNPELFELVNYAATLKAPA
jgi:hypothetical protein